MTSSAVLSTCKRYRYRLDRRWGVGPTMGFIMLNPSTADAEQNDPTIRRCIRFAQREGCGALLVVNVYPYRATDPEELWKLDYPTREGPREADVEFDKAVNAADVLVAAWGAGARGGEAGIMLAYGARLLCLGETKHGHPRHPLYVRGDTPLTPYLAPYKNLHAPALSD
jgi:hypothetical protein